MSRKSPTGPGFLHFTLSMWHFPEMGHTVVDISGLEEKISEISFQNEFSKKWEKIFFKSSQQNFFVVFNKNCKKENSLWVD